MSDELEKTSVGENDESDQDIEAHKHAIGKTSVGKTSVDTPLTLTLKYEDEDGNYQPVKLNATGLGFSDGRAGAPEGEEEGAGRLECRWQRDQLPQAIRELVLDDQRLRNDICWSVFDC